MGRAFYAFVRAVRKQPNLFAVACGLFMFLLPGLFFDAVLVARGRRAPSYLAPMIDLWGRFADSVFAMPVMFAIMGAGIFLALLGMGGIFRPRRD